ncbi:alpha/beta-hydrolase [Thozetella sp. PMI_491]|nr:alpha/beta-hydrolase [Thozetella sp. PMI_491]
MPIYNTLPAQAKPDALSPFKVNVSDADLDRMKTLIKLSNLADPSYENSLPDGSRDLGLRREWLKEAKRVWEQEFDWRTHEQLLNSFPNYQATIPTASSPGSPGIKIHFIALFSENPSAVPVLLLHGWPGSVLEFLPLLSLVQEKYSHPAQLPYHVIVPSLPGYTFSDILPQDHDSGLEDVARMMDYLMTNVLGLSKYVVQAGDVGSRVGRILCAQYPQCQATLLNYSPVPPPEGFDFGTLSESEKRGIARQDWFKSHGAAYALFQATRPGTLGLVLSSNPLALLAWIGEKFLDWTDPASFPADSTLPGEQHVTYSKALMKEAIVSVSLYWLTGKAHSCFYSYRETYGLTGGPPRSHASPEYHIHAPKRLGFSYFPMEVAPVPRAWIETSGNLVFWKAHGKGGHFAALEQPHAILEDLEEFINVL